MEAPQPKLELRAMTREDLPEILALAQAQGRNVHRSEYERFAGLEGAEGIVLRRDGKLEGAVTLIRYFENGFVGPLLMQPGQDAVGFSMVLMSRAVETLQRSGANLLDAEAGEAEASVLAGMGFERVRRTLVLERQPRAPSGAAGATRPMEPRHFLDVGALDAAAVGHGRKEFLFSLMEDHPEGARVVEEDGEVTGYVFVRRSRRGYHVGPLVTREGDLQAAGRLLADALESAAGWPAVALAPEGGGLLDALRSAGFVEVGGLSRMRAGAPGRSVADEWAPAPATEWLIGSRITG